MAPRASSTRKTHRAASHSANQQGVNDIKLGAVRLGVLRDWIGFQLRMAQSASFQAFAREAQNYELERPGWFATLVLIGENPGITPTALSQANGRDKSTLTPVLAKLSQRGLIRRVRAKQDRRNYHLTLTAAGQQALAGLLACAKRHERNLDRIVGKKDRACFLRTLQQISAELDRNNVG